MTNLIEKLNVELIENEEFTSDVGCVISARNCIEVHSCKPEYVIQALEMAGYYESDGEFSLSDLDAICATIDDFACNEIESRNDCLSKHIWFDGK